MMRMSVSSEWRLAPAAATTAQYAAVGECSLMRTYGIDHVKRELRSTTVLEMGVNTRSGPPSCCASASRSP
jgi:hypothetical protein